MPQFLVDPEVLRHPPVVIRGADARHIMTVLRLGPGDRLVLTDGAGHRYEARITAARPLHVAVTIVRALPTPRMSAELTVAAAVVRPERFEWMIEKLFELGCRRLIPMTTERSVEKYLPRRSMEKLARWQMIAQTAAKQSGLPWRPEVTEITPLEEVLHARSRTQLYYCWEGMAVGLSKRVTPGGGPPWPPAAANAAMPGHGGDRRQDPPPNRAIPTILIGPEGGFTPDEHNAIMAHHPTLLPLGPLILRTETAALTALTLVQQSHRYFELP